MHPVRKWEGGMGEGSYEKMSERDVGRNGFNGYGKGCGVERGKTGLGVLGNRSMGTEMWSHA